MEESHKEPGAGGGGAGTPQTLQTHALRGCSCPDSLIAQERPHCPCSEQAASPGRSRYFQRGEQG